MNGNLFTQFSTPGYLSLQVYIVTILNYIKPSCASGPFSTHMGYPFSQVPSKMITGLVKSQQAVLKGES